MPIPGVDLIADVGLLAKMLPDISQRFGLDHAAVEAMEPRTASKALVFASSIGNTVIGRMVTKRMAVAILRRVGIRLAAASAAKVVPIVGSVLAASVSFGAMKMAGNAHIDDCYETARRLIEQRDVLTDVATIGD